ncbi:O-antigen ligase family protein [Streptomyces sp. S1D4-11]
MGAALAATTLASRACRRRTVQWPALTWSFLIVGLVAVISVSVAYRQPSDLPVVGGLVGRMQASENDADSEAANNVELRYVMWRTALDVARSEPLLGAGAGRPIEVVFQGAELDKAASGPHNSFVGYVYYLGWLAGTAFALLIVATLWRTWRARSHPVASAWFGATVGVCCIAFTNVAFETTYIGLPSWLVVACAFALVGVPRTAVPKPGTPARRPSHGRAARTSPLLRRSPVPGRRSSPPIGPGAGDRCSPRRPTRLRRARRSVRSAVEEYPMHATQNQGLRSAGPPGAPSSAPGLGSPREGFSLGTRVGRGRWICPSRRVVRPRRRLRSTAPRMRRPAGAA